LSLGQLRTLSSAAKIAIPPQNLAFDVIEPAGLGFRHPEGGGGPGAADHTVFDVREAIYRSSTGPVGPATVATIATRSAGTISTSRPSPSCLRASAAGSGCSIRRPSNSRVGMDPRPGCAVVPQSIRN